MARSVLLTPEMLEDIAELARLVVGELEVGILVCTPNLDRVLLSNPAADRMLTHWRNGSAPTLALRQTIREALSRRAAAGNFPSALPLRRAAGPCLFVRAKMLPADRAAIVLISEEMQRERGRDDALVTRFQLSPRESQIVQLVCAGMTNDEIGDRLNLAAATVKQYLHSIYTTLDVHSRAKLIAAVEQMDC
jgi:DNA-binding NarL/FixJ family response regulator